MLDWGAYQFHPAFVLGFHGAEKSIVDKVVQQQKRIHLDHSTKSYDWLGHGVYFWENDPARGLEWAVCGKKNEKIKRPDVVGAIIDLGRCLDLTTRCRLTTVFELLSRRMIRSTRMLALGQKITSSCAS